MSAPTRDDLAQVLPLHGPRFIEASAGTGKTFALTSLVLRVLLERGLPIDALLAVTFTRAAATELRERVRRRLRIALRLLDGEAPADGEAVATRAILDAALADGDAARVRVRVEGALRQADVAQISTIHGFCQRALREFGFRAGLLAPRTPVDDPADAWAAVADDLWRHSAQGDAARHQQLVDLFDSPAGLAKRLPKLCDPSRLQRPETGTSEAATLLHAVRAEAQARFDARMARQGTTTQDALIADMWSAMQDPAFARAVATRYPCVLVDEFQDTDPRQWAIFRALYEHADPALRWLCLVGDPKQAIYRFRGGDLDTYLEARDWVAAQHDVHGEGTASLDANYRSAPGVLRAVEAVFTALPDPFLNPGIAFHPLQAMAPVDDGDLSVDCAPQPAMTVHWLGEADDELADVADARARIEAATVDAIATLLRTGRLRRGDVEGPLRPGDIAVLVQTNKQAGEIRTALMAAGIPASTMARDSVFQGEAAMELHVLLRALADPSDPGRVRAALATRIGGLNARALEALEADGTAVHAGMARIEEGAEAWRRRGPLPALLPFLTESAARLLAVEGGTRLVTDALHLAELLQAASADVHGVGAQLQWFARQCAAEVKGEHTQLRLEADTGLVQVLTIHMSKGLEFPVVVLPYAADPGKGKTPSGLADADVRDREHGPMRVWSRKEHLVDPGAEDLKALIARDEAAERRRQLYVALTRARNALHVVWMRGKETASAPLFQLLHGEAKLGKSTGPTRAEMRATLDGLATASGGAIAVHDVPAVLDVSAPLAMGEPAEAMPAPATPVRRFAPDARLHSFSRLHDRAGDVAAAPGAEDERAVWPQDDDGGLGGAEFGNAVHDVLEGADAPQWALARGAVPDATDPCPPGQRALVEAALRQYGLAAVPAHVAQVARLVARALNVTLPGGERLCALPATRCVREMPFHFRMRGVRLDALDALLEGLGWPRLRRMAPARLEGLMHGYIDLVYRDDAGRHHVLDYKTNRLPAYDPDALRRAVALQEYDLQYLIYLVALRRWLRQRRGAAYDDGRDLGGAVYLFLRGIDLADPASRAGLHVDAMHVQSIAALDAFFDGASVDDALGGRGA